MNSNIPKLKYNQRKKFLFSIRDRSGHKRLPQINLFRLIHIQLI